jgi:hypothetical protein
VRCFRVDEKASVGIPLATSEDGLHIEVGDENVKLDPELTKSIQAARSIVLEKIRECLYTGKLGTQALSEEEVEELMDMEEQASDLLSLMYVDVEEGKIVKERRPSPKALVLVETAPGLGGRLKFKSTSFLEVYDTRSGRVRRQYREEFPPPGVEVLAEGKSGDRGRCLLLQMIPGSSFRIERTGDLEGIPGVLTVVWKGQKGVAGAAPLEVFSPSSRARDPEMAQA